jgi:hypothetical protein
MEKLIINGLDLGAMGIGDDLDRTAIDAVSEFLLGKITFGGPVYVDVGPWILRLNLVDKFDVGGRLDDNFDWEYAE